MKSNFYFNYNGEIHAADELTVSIHNRSFRYGDGLFETMRWQNGDIQYLSYHVARLHKDMALLKMEGAKLLDTFFIKQQASLLIKRNKLEGPVRIRLSVFRDGGGLYSPETNKAAFLLEVSSLKSSLGSRYPAGLIIDVYKEHTKSINRFSAIKSNNALLFVMAGIYRKQQGLDEVILLNENGLLCESSSANIFIWYRNSLYTPALSEGCVDGVMRRVIMEVAKINNIEVIEAQINPEILNEAEEMFLTNAVHGMQWVLGYKKKRFFNRLSKDLYDKLIQWQAEKEAEA